MRHHRSAGFSQTFAAFLLCYPVFYFDSYLQLFFGSVFRCYSYFGILLRFVLCRLIFVLCRFYFVFFVFVLIRIKIKKNVFVPCSFVLTLRLLTHTINKVMSGVRKVGVSPPECQKSTAFYFVSFGVKLRGGGDAAKSWMNFNFIKNLFLIFCFWILANTFQICHFNQTKCWPFWHNFNHRLMSVVTLFSFFVFVGLLPDVSLRLVNVNFS